MEDLFLNLGIIFQYFPWISLHPREFILQQSIRSLDPLGPPCHVIMRAFSKIPIIPSRAGTEVHSRVPWRHLLFLFTWAFKSSHQLYDISAILGRMQVILLYHVLGIAKSVRFSKAPSIRTYLRTME